VVSETLARRYAVAVFSLASAAGTPDAVGSDLDTIAATLANGGLTHDFFVAPVVTRQDKERVFTLAYEGRVNEIALHTLLLLVRKRREALLPAIVDEYKKLQLQARGAERLWITSARPLKETELHSIVARLEQLHDEQFEVRETVDPNLIGGARILIGDRRIDGTVSGRLDALARSLHAGN
jgi:F-type H+-transporting ATPase subunit delta